jgi:hypothetical protein
MVNGRVPSSCDYRENRNAARFVRDSKKTDENHVVPGHSFQSLASSSEPDFIAGTPKSS